jgi:hypothetical protein
MYILYVDESGVEQIEAGTSHFILLGLMIPEEHWKSLDTALENTKDKYGLREIKIHTAWICRRYAEQESTVPIRKVVRSGCLNCTPLSSLHQFVP